MMDTRSTSYIGAISATLVAVCSCLISCRVVSLYTSPCLVDVEFYDDHLSNLSKKQKKKELVQTYSKFYSAESGLTFLPRIFNGSLRRYQIIRVKRTISDEVSTCNIYIITVNRSSLSSSPEAF